MIKYLNNIINNLNNLNNSSDALISFYIYVRNEIVQVRVTYKLEKSSMES